MFNYISKLLIFNFTFLSILFQSNISKCGIVLEVVQDQIVKKKNIDFSKGNYIKIGDTILKIVDDGGNNFLKEYNKTIDIKHVNKNLNNDNKIKDKNNKKETNNTQMKQNNNNKSNKQRTIAEEENDRIEKLLADQKKMNEELVKKANNLNTIIDNK